VKVAAGVGVELRQIYLPGRRSHHPNDAPQHTSSNYKTEEERGPLPLLPPERQAEGEGPRAHAGGDEIWPPPSGREEQGQNVAEENSPRS
jgi:hypothetical protein